jgi:hypothetical protein
MPITIKLDEGPDLVVDVSPHDLEKAFRTALGNNEVLRISSEDRVLAINPRRILYWIQEGRTEVRPTPHPDRQPEAAGAR